MPSLETSVQSLGIVGGVLFVILAVFSVAVWRMTNRWIDSVMVPESRRRIDFIDKLDGSLDVIKANTTAVANGVNNMAQELQGVSRGIESHTSTILNEIRAVPRRCANEGK